MKPVFKGVVGRIAGMLKANPRNTLEVEHVSLKGGVRSCLTVSLHRRGRLVRKRKYRIKGGRTW